MKYYVVLWQSQDGSKMAEVFGKKAEAKTHLSENFNAYGKPGAEMKEYDAQTFNELVTDGTNLQFH